MSTATRDEEKQISPEESVFATLTRVADRLGIHTDRSSFEPLSQVPEDHSIPLSRALMDAAKAIGIS